MRKFIGKTISFITYLIIPIVIIFAGSFIIINNGKYWKLPKKTDYIVLGHSHPECAFNDSQISGLVNLGKSGESYFYTYLKANKIIPNNKTLKAVFIEFGNSNIEKNMDSWIWDNEHIQQNFPRFFSLLDYSDFKLLMENNSKSILNCPPSRYIKEIGYTYLSSLIIKKNFLSNTRFGGYNYLDYSKIDSLINNKVPNNKNNEINKKDISETNLKYLQKIVELCNENGIKVFLIRSPLHTKYLAEFHEEEFKRVQNSYFQNIEFLDLASFPLQNNEYADLEHLNYKGAHKFSIWFNQILRNNLLEDIEEQLIIHKTIQASTHNNTLN
ncbi:hypothetical protein [Arenibacter echinorum]|uniref:SGNH/GDSL hydrolase family protein n=1 Tax=Arenibacter echinorum TaxID=440515 RepID=A0A327QT52_9FLAO|nr:hypothetical protein [Arenibacter echinorum]RAJ07128.1 hypothetical protein LV92_04030 [Arenibacter echinorum]